MAAPVWVLSVDLQTKTASFTTGLADAARQARGSFNTISEGAKGMGEGVAQGGANVRAAIGLIDNTIRGAHAMAMADLVREFSQTKIVMAALPFAAVVAGIAAVAGIAVEAYEKFKEWCEEQEKLAAAQTKMGTTAREALNSLDDKLLEAGKRTDELRNDHVAALKKELELIDHQSLDDLMKTFDIFGKAADSVFEGLKSHWYTFGIGASGAKHALDQFDTQYKSLLAQGKDKDAGDLLAGTLSSAKEVLKYQQQAINAGVSRGALGVTGNQAALADAKDWLDIKGKGVGYTKDEVAAQEALVGALRAQTTAQTKIAELKGIQGSNAKTETGNEGSARAAEAARQAITSRLAIAEQGIAGDRAIATAQLTIQRASVEARLASELDFAQREYNVKMDANRQLTGALDKAGKDYQNQLKELNNKSSELTAAHVAEEAELRSRATIEQNQRDLANFEGGQRALIAAEQEGSYARIAAINEASRRAEQLGLQDTDFYRSLGVERVNVARQIASDEAKQAAEAGKIAAENTLQTGQLALAAQEQTWNLQDSARRVHEADVIARELEIEQREFAMRLAANIQEQAALDASGKDYENKLRALQNKETQLIRQHENEKTQIKTSAEIQRNTRLLSAEQAAEQTMAKGLTGLLLRHQSAAQNRAVRRTGGGFAYPVGNSFHGCKRADKDFRRWEGRP